MARRVVPSEIVIAVVTVFVLLARMSFALWLPVVGQVHKVFYVSISTLMVRQNELTALR